MVNHRRSPSGCPTVFPAAPPNVQHIGVDTHTRIPKCGVEEGGIEIPTCAHSHSTSAGVVVGWIIRVLHTRARNRAVAGADQDRAVNAKSESRGECDEPASARHGNEFWVGERHCVRF